MLNDREIVKNLYNKNVFGKVNSFGNVASGYTFFVGRYHLQGLNIYLTRTL